MTSYTFFWGPTHADPFNYKPNLSQVGLRPNELLACLTSGIAMPLRCMRALQCSHAAGHPCQGSCFASIPEALLHRKVPTVQVSLLYYINTDGDHVLAAGSRCLA